ncbi:DNA translocase FtsK [Fictibacillus phosphorivorans]|uniref:DNA translocase FtsK n=1 Tax=Fictibacillus phosphorivorans TaxID=1221500 RepID=UPI001292E8B6|nr:DNA translocase FtsK [Fictibacillus phosphorivorans]MQR95244.1 DNA translocase FtsK [Fictibacillus phosphorivorans]
MSWIKKLMNTFFDDENEDDSYYEEERTRSQESVKKQQSPERMENTQKTKPAPFASNRRKPSQSNIQHPAKMLHKYPENAPFRFPVIPDEKIAKPVAQRHTYSQNETHPYKDSSREEKSYQEARPVREQRSTQNESRRSKGTTSGFNQETRRQGFKASNVPSPVYGYERRNKNDAKSKPEQKETTPEVKSRFTPTDVPSPVYGYGKRKPEGILFIGRDIPEKDSVTEELLKTVKEVLPAPTTENLMVSQEVESETSYLQEQNHGLVDQKQIQVKDESTNMDRDIVEEEKHSESLEMIVESEDVYVSKEVDEDYSLNTEKQNQMLEPVEELEVAEKRTERPERQPVQEIAPSIVEETQLQENVVIEQTQPKKETPKSGGQFVPFNVLMLKKDRKSLTRPVSKPEIQKLESRQTPRTELNIHQRAEAVQNQLYVPLSLLNKSKISLEDDDLWLNEQKETLQSTLDNFNVNAKVVHMTKGPAVTRFEVQPAPGVKVNKITNLTDDIKLSLAARDIRIEAPIPGKNAIGIEVPNQHSRAVYLREIIEDDVFKDSSSSLTVALGLDISGAPVVTDLQKMPHGLIAGATGSGKSVCINSILVSLLYKAKPEDVRLLLVDPKMVELAPYNHIPHLVTPVITDAKEATAALKWAVEEMERRYEEFAKTGVREIKRYNQKMEEEQHYKNKMPYIVVVIDELADLMMVSPQEVEEAICRIAQKARACGIHLLLATQRPSVDVITGLIKANVPTRTAFAVSSAIDSRTILDMSGAERLLGRGDMLFMENGSNKAVRIQGTFVSDEEIEEVTRYVKEEYQTEYLFTREELIQHQQTTEVEDELFEEACYYVIEVGAASSSSLQRRFRIGYNRAARLVDMMESFGLVSETMGSKPRHVLLTQEELENRLYSGVE